MQIEELQKMLLEAYTIKNLNSISLTLIRLYRSGNFGSLQKISEIIGDLVPVRIGDDGKGFSKMIMLYHPDRADLHINEINRLAEEKEMDRLLEYSHILKLERIEEIAEALKSYEDIDYAPVYEWDVETEGFSVITDNGSDDFIKPKPERESSGYAFYDAVKIREYGHTEIEYPSYYLEDIEEFELSSSDIDDLDGVQFCLNAKTIDLSDNKISDLAPLFGLINLQELNLCDNQIGYIDGISNMLNLKSLRLSNNFIDDITPLFEMQNLEYVDVTGNRIDLTQIKQLLDSGVVVDY